MAEFRVDYSDLAQTSANAKNAAKATDNYAKTIRRGACMKLNDLTGGATALTQDVENSLDEKAKQLNHKTDRLNNFAVTIDKFSKSVQDGDNAIGSLIQTVK